MFHAKGASRGRDSNRCRGRLIECCKGSNVSLAAPSAGSNSAAERAGIDQGHRLCFLPITARTAFFARAAGAAA